MSTFAERQAARLGECGWTRCPSVADAVARAGLAAPTRDYLLDTVSAAEWAGAERALDALRQRFHGARFADEVTWGLLLVPDHRRLDTRAPMPAPVRRDQPAVSDADFADERLGPGTLGIPAPADWTLVATAVGPYGPALGSHDRVTGAPAAEFTVLGRDTRALMIRQLWGARVLQAGGADLPDSDANARWTFTLFPGEPLTAGQAESGTVLKGRVRFRLGKPDRGIGSARVAPALLAADACPT